jgi:hypothetical protein
VECKLSLMGATCYQAKMSGLYVSIGDIPCASVSTVFQLECSDGVILFFKLYC